MDHFVLILRYVNEQKQTLSEQDKRARAFAKSAPPLSARQANLIAGCLKGRFLILDGELVAATHDASHLATVTDIATRASASRFKPQDTTTPLAG